MTLDQFIESEMKKRGMSLREFAKLIDISPSAISKYLNSASERGVSIDFMVKLARGTNTDLSSIVAMVYPDDTTINPQARILAERIINLPPDKRQMVESLLLGMSLQSDKGSDEK